MTNDEKMELFFDAITEVFRDIDVDMEELARADKAFDAYLERTITDEEINYWVGKNNLSK